MKAGVAPNGRPYQVLIAENSRFQAKQLAQILESEGYQVIGFAENGKELVKLYDEHRRIDLITLDLNLPVMDGYATFFEIKERGVLPRIVIVSEENTPAVLKNLIDEGAMDYIPKPVKREKVLEKINAAVKKVPKV
ncbi:MULTISPECIES: response regulator [Leptospira]|uniref:Response regulator receiver domain protein n=14 Tax=Leptospira TaxID=171 RepID=M3HLE8_LEPBO|nr:MULTISPECIES: response regulator [Leptospira]EMF98930.1 response regulator receiver domain protein [Leptospira borgpetersenii str. 200701203]EMO08261.1 response regulator receiver domain protein [Leptospira borgpetersenii str. Noumea 25]EMO57996.1 response regulator receiver domain protein [Leptospira santarosai str. CBC1416]ABJ76385.1 Receiver component of a two-component response regulator [Leptospira borgpetersenii serovar Hardjo-bovis str. JB197]ABJ78909.1 Receiver component of a two-co